MENPAHVYTTGIPMSEKGNFTHNKYGCDVVETLEDVPLEKLEDHDYPNNTGINLYDSTSENTQYINSFQNGCEDGDSLNEVEERLERLVPHDYPSSSNVILCNSSPKNGEYLNCIQDDFQQSEILCGFVCNAADADDLGIQNSSLEVQSIQDSDTHIKFPDSPGSTFTCKIESFSSIEGLDQGLDEQIDNYLLSSDFQKVNKPQSDASADSLEEEQRNVTEAISAIAKSFGLEDLLPENFQVDGIKDLPVSPDTLCNDEEEPIGEISLDFEKCTPLDSTEAPIDLPQGFELNGLELLTTHNEACDTSKNSETVIPVKAKDRFFIIPKESYDGTSLLSDDRVKTDLHFESDLLIKPVIEEVDMKLEYESVSDVTAQNNICDVGEDLSCDVPTVRIEDVQVSDCLEKDQNGSSAGTVVITRDKTSKKMQIVLTLEKGQQIFNIDTESIDPSEQSLNLDLQTVADEQEIEDSIDVDQTDELEYSVELESEKSNDFCDEEASVFKEPSNFVDLVSNITVAATKGNLGRKSKKKWICPIEYCGQILDKECKLRVHMISHKTSSRPFKCDFDGCDWAFTTPYRLRRHAETHLGSKDFLCDFEGCNRKFTTVYNLKTHSKRHKWPNSLICPSKDCEMTFANRRKLELHLRVHKDVEAPYKCDLCGKQYYSANCIASHYRTHQYNEDDFKCPFPECGKVYDKICRLRQHIRHHTGDRPYTCPAEGCKWSFMSASKLTRHMRKHTGERKFMCTEPGCGKSFMRPEHLKGHIVIHSGDKPFHCPHENCTAKFTAKSSLYVHVKKHCSSVLKVVYPCPIVGCVKKYNSKATLKQHLNKSHPETIGEGIDIAEKLELTMPVTVVNPEVDNSSSRFFELDDDGADDPSNDLTFQLLTESSLEEVTSTFNLGADSGPVTVDAVEVPSASKTTKKNSHSRPTRSKNTVKLFISEKLTKENHSGCARTDYSCKSGVVFKRSVQSNFLLHNQCSSDIPDTRSYLSNSQLITEIRSPDLMLASTIIFNDTCCSEPLIKTHFLQDECSTSHSLYHDDSILVSSSAFETELIPGSLLSDGVESDESVLNHSGMDFSEQNSVDTFAESIRLHGLD